MPFLPSLAMLRAHFNARGFSATLRPRAIIVIAALLLLPAMLRARQSSASPATVDILVKDPSGAGISHAHVRVVPFPENPPAKMETDENGHLLLTLMAGTYAVFVSAQGFSKTSQHFEVNAPGAGKSAQVVTMVLPLGATGSPTAVYPENSLVLTADLYHPPVALSPADFRALPRVTVKVHNSHSNKDEAYSGVLLQVLLAKVNAPLGKNFREEALSSYLIATGSDGYSVALSLAEIELGKHSGEIMVADTRDGQPLGKSGPYELIVPDDQRPARWVHNLGSITLLPDH